MGLFQHYIRQFVRNNFKPINPVRARIWNRRLQLMFYFCSWNCAAIWFYMTFIMKREKDINEEPLLLRTAKRMGIDQTEIIHITNKGITRTSAAEELQRFEEQKDRLTQKNNVENQES